MVKDDRESMASQRTVFFDSGEGVEGEEDLPPFAIAGIERKVHRLCREFFFYRQTNRNLSTEHRQIAIVSRGFKIGGRDWFYIAFPR